MEYAILLVLAVCFFVFLLLGIPIAFVLALCTVPYILAKPHLPLIIIPQKFFTGLDSFLLVALPFFILASTIMNTGGITKRIVGFVNHCIGHIRGGLAHVNVAVSMIFAGLTGMAMADTAAVGSILIPAMKEEGYDKDFSCAVTASSSTIGPIIPPSFLFIMYSLAIGGTSIAALFLAGIIPGILLGIFQMIIVAFYAHKKKYPIKKHSDLIKIAQSMIEVLPALIVPIIMIGGIVFGMVTPTEAACLAVIAALIVSILVYKELRISQLFKIFVETGIQVGSIMFILAGATILSWVLAREQVPQMAVKYLTLITDNRILLLLLINIFLLIVGMVMDPTPSMMILAPLLLPLANALGLSTIQFGVMITLNLVIGLTTPPVGVCLFIAAAIGRTTVERLSRAIIPFLLVNIAVLLLVTYFASITELIPRLLYK